MQVVERVLADLGPYLEAVERELRQASDDSGPQMREITRHMVEAGGKRLRPILTLLSARVFGEDSEKTVPIAAAAELIHMATLAHDDVIDEATTRRGALTVNSRWDNHTGGAGRRRDAGPGAGHAGGPRLAGHRAHHGRHDPAHVRRRD